MANHVSITWAWKGGIGGELGETMVTDGKDSFRRGGTQARIRLQEQHQEA